MTKSFVVVVCLTSLAIGTLPSAAQQMPCRETRVFSAEEYWFWDGYFGFVDVRDESSQRTGRLESDHLTCFTVPRSVLNDDEARLRGYRRAVEEWLGRLPRAREEWDTNSARAVRKQLTRLTGIDLPSREAWTQWWVDNNAYFRWSAKQGHLVVDEQAKQNQVPTIELAPELNAENYWFYKAQGKLKNERPEGQFIRADAWTAHGWQPIRVPMTALEDREQKLAGMTQGARNLILDRLALPELRDSDAAEVMRQLQQLTGLGITTRQGWITWWERNKTRLELSADGERLVVRTPR